MSHLIFAEECYAVVGAAMKVYYTIGVGFAEPVYQECFGIELGIRNIPFEREKELELYYCGRLLEKKYRPDFVCFGEIIVELKVLHGLSALEESQIINYLKVSRKPLGLLINFGSRPKLEWKRYALSV